MTKDTSLPPAAKKRTPWLALLPLVIFVALAAVFTVQLVSGKDNSTIPSVLIGKEAPVTKLPPIDGLAHNNSPLPGLDSSDFITGPEGKLTLVNVWASWCAPCRQEHPILMELAKDKRLRVVGLNYKDQPENARRFLGELGNPYEAVGADNTGRSTIDWGVYGVPETFLVNQEGKIVYKHVGPITPTAVRNEMMPVIEKNSQN